MLAIDSDPLVLADFRQVMRDLPARLVLAGSLLEARAYLSAEVPSIIFSEQHLPDGDGLAYLEEVHARFPWVQRVLHTARRVAQRATGADVPVLAKPCPRETLRELIAALVGDLEARRASPPSGGRQRAASID